MMRSWDLIYISMSERHGCRTVAEGQGRPFCQWQDEIKSQSAFASSGMPFLLVTFLWARKEKSPASAAQRRAELF